MNGEELLNKLYKDLNKSKEVIHTSKGASNKDEAVKKYLDRLERIHTKASKRESDIQKLKYLYHQKYVVKENDIPSYRDKERIIKSQEESLDKWIDYLLDENSKYPMWAKYWAFQGMLKIGTYDEKTNTYQKRSKKTLHPFIEVNPEIIAKCIGLITEYAGKEKINDNTLKSIIETGNFQKLYTIYIKKKKNDIQQESNKEDGIWITYHHETEEEANEKETKGEMPEYLKLYNSLQGHNTGWCTAGDKETAKDQICGIDTYVGGEFHVYYTKDENNEYKIPRIAIRMEENDIGEIRGIAEGQNIEDGLESIIEQKLKSIPTLKEIDIKKNLIKIDNMKKLTELNKKNKNKEEFTEEDILFIYELERRIQGFGYEKDNRIEEIVDSRDEEEDFKKLTDPQLVLEMIKAEDMKIENMNPKLRTNKEIIQEAVRQNGLSLEYADASLKKDRATVYVAVVQNGLALEFADESLKKDKKIVLEAVYQNGLALAYADKSLQKDKEIVLEAVIQNGLSLAYADQTLKKDPDIAIEAIYQNEYALKYVDEELRNNDNFMLEVQKIFDEKNKKKR